MADFNAVAQQFVTFYYDTFDSNRPGLVNLYQPSSMMTFENTPIQGADSIMEKLSNLPFEQVKHQVATMDAQPSGDTGGILVLVTGALLVDAEQRPMSYCQSFQLLPSGGSYFVQNDIFKLVYPAS